MTYRRPVLLVNFCRVAQTRPSTLVHVKPERHEVGERTMTKTIIEKIIYLEKVNLVYPSPTGPTGSLVSDFVEMNEVRTSHATTRTP